MDQNTPDQSRQDLYAQLRQDAHLLTGTKPRLAGGDKSMTDHVENLFIKSETVIRSMLDKNNNYGTSDLIRELQEAFLEMHRKLKQLGDNCITRIEDSSLASAVDKQIVKKFWHDVDNFVKSLIDWMKQTILETWTGDGDEQSKDFIVQDVLESGLDLIWGMHH